ncbi:MAG: hypothetical protein ACKVQS_08130 [Fimbriimonadaceae bacterium]
MTNSVLALAMMGVLHTPVQDKVVDLSVKGSTLRVIADELGKEAGWKPTLDPSVENEVLVLRTKGMTVPVLIAKISEVTGTKWLQNGDQMLIQPDFTVRNAALAKVKAENAKQIIEARTKYYESLKPQKYKDGEEEFTYDPDKESLLLGSMVRGLSDQFLTSLAPGQRVVLSTNPTSMQRALGRIDVQAITDWIARENESRKVSEEDRQQMANDPEYQQYIEMFGNQMEQMMPKPITEAPQKVLLVAERSGRTDFDPIAITISLRVMGAKGNVLLENQMALSSEGDEYYDGMTAVATQEVRSAAEARGIPMPAGQEVQEPPRKPMPGDDILLTPSADVKTIFDASHINFKDLTATKMSARARELMMRTDLYEPMQFELGEFLYEAAEKRNMNLVALLPDFVNQYSEELPKKLIDVRESFPGFDLNETEADGWWSILPKEPAAVWAKRMDRRVLAGTLIAAQNKLFVPLDVLSTFMFRFPDAESNPMVSQRLRIFAPQMQNIMGGVGDDSQMMRVFGGMTQQERQVMRNGGSIPIAGLSAGPRSVLQEKFFGYRPTISPVDIEKDLNPQSPVDMMSGMMGMGMMLGGGGAGQTEPTELMPVGLPGNGMVSMRVNRENYMIALSKDGSMLPSVPPFGRIELSFLALMMKSPDVMNQMQEVNQMLQNLRTGVRDQLHMVVLIAPGQGAKSILSDPHDPDMSTSYSISNLPPAVRQQMDADSEALSKSPMGKFFEAMGGMGGMGGGGVIKP